MGSGLIGSKEVEGLGRTELLSSEAEDCSGCVSNPAGWPAGADALPRVSKSPLLLDSAAETPHSGKSHRHTPERHLPPAPKQVAAAQTDPSPATLAEHGRLHSKQASCFHPAETPRSCCSSAGEQSWRCQAAHKLRAHPHSNEHKPGSRLHQENRSQHVQGSHIRPLGAEAALAILCPASGIPWLKKDAEEMQLRAAKMARALGHTDYKEGWRELGLFRRAKSSLRASNSSLQLSERQLQKSRTSLWCQTM